MNSILTKKLKQWYCGDGIEGRFPAYRDHPIILKVRVVDETDDVEYSARRIGNRKPFDKATVPVTRFADMFPEFFREY